MSLEDTFKSWAQPLGEIESSRCENAERMIKDAINNDRELSNMDISVFTQGSYKSNTNVRQGSDIDICVCLNSTFYYEFDKSLQPVNLADYCISPSNVNFGDFRNTIGTALVNKFGQAGVRSGNKAYNVSENSYRVNADVLPAFKHRYYTGIQHGIPRFIEGIGFITVDGIRINNWPEQVYTKGVKKNDSTSRRYKSIVRILKRLRDKMIDDNYSAARDVNSFMLASMIWNIPDTYFGHQQLYGDVREALAQLFNKTITDDECREWVEVNDIKYLFHFTQRWSRQGAHDFIGAAWNYLGLE